MQDALNAALMCYNGYVYRPGRYNALTPADLAEIAAADAAAKRPVPIPKKPAPPAITDSRRVAEMLGVAGFHRPTAHVTRSDRDEIYNIVQRLERELMEARKQRERKTG